MAVSFYPATFYAQWRAQHGLAPALRDRCDSPPEHLLQTIWQHQRLLREQLRTLDGQVVRVVHPGFHNLEGGPDFRGAVVQIGDAPPRAGDVEVDLSAGGWRAHGHDRNPAFQNVILHVIWKSERPVAKGPPGMALCDSLDAPIGELSLWLAGESPRALPENFRGQCCAPLRTVAPEKIGELLQEAARVRFHSKAARFQARARQAGWEQALWEGIFRALGYKHNVWPMQCVAESRTRWLSPKLSPLELQARLFGISGLLPAELTAIRTGADTYLRRIWDCWWRERDEFEDCVLPRALWRFHGLRPANHPQRRLALAAHWLAAGDLIPKIERWSAATVSDPVKAGPADLLLEILQVERDEFWQWHWTFRSARLNKSQPLLGATRATDLAVNALLPWLWARAAEATNEKLRLEIENRFNAWPPAEDNAVLRLARQRLLGGAPRRALRTAAEQQGLLQLVRDFCDHSNAACEGCQFPDLVHHWNMSDLPEQ
jgi:uncharacterized protein DUF2851